jgi:hypothetical protein
MPSNNPNLLKRAYENLMGTPEQNKKAKEEIEKYKASKAKEKEKEEAEKKMAKGGAVKGFKPCAGCPTPAKCKAAGKCLAKKMAKGGMSKKPVLAIMIGLGKPMPAKKKAKK